MSFDIVIVLGLLMKTFLGETVSQQTSWNSGSYNFSASYFAVFPEASVQELWHIGIHWGCVPPNLLISGFVVFCRSLHLLERGASWMSGGCHTYLWI